MSHPTLSMLDQAELLQLATNASSGGDSASAIAYLKEAVSRSDATAIAHYLLGAEYAQIKMYERAVGEMEAALALDPALSIARLQLGLLWLTANAPERADSVLAPLAELPQTDPLRHFGAGLCHLIHDQAEEAVVRLEQGIALNTTNAPLNSDMRNMLNALATLRPGSGAAGSAAPAATPAAEPEPAPEAAGASHHVLLSAYTGNTSH